MRRDHKDELAERNEAATARAQDLSQVSCPAIAALQSKPKLIQV